MNKQERVNIFVLPSNNKNNKYIDLLISSLKKRFLQISSEGGLNMQIQKAEKDTLLSIFIFILKNIKYKNCLPVLEKNIIHIQWPTVLYGSAFAIKSIALIIFNSILIIILKILFKTKIVWTVHNFTSHDYPNHLIDIVGSKMVYFFADHIVLQQKVILDEYKRMLPNKRFTYIPHGNYIGVYGSDLNREDVKDLRKSFGFKEDDSVLLSLGAISPYKQNEKIIDAVISVRNKRPDIKLLIIGKAKKDYVDVLKEYIKMTISKGASGGINFSDSGCGIVIKDEFVADYDIPKYYALSDYSVFYYDKSEMTSGSIILSLSYGLPVITKNIPGAEMINDKSGFVFEDEDSFYNTLLNLPKTIPVEHGGANVYSKHDIIDTVKDKSFDSGAVLLVGVYSQLIKV